MSDTLPLQVVYAGLAGTLLALIVAAATNGWSLRVFLLLALRLAIGWHFLFEGLHKIHSHMVGPTETSRPFTSEPYFAAAQGPFGDYVRKSYLGDSEAIITNRIAPMKVMTVVDFEALSAEEQAKLCPTPVAEALEKAATEGETYAAEEVNKAEAKLEKVKSETDLAKLEAEAKQTADALAAAIKDGAAKEKIKDLAATAEDANTAVTLAKANIAAAELAVASAKDQADALKNNGRRLKITYARWVFGADKPDAKAAFVSGDVPQGVPDRLGHIALLKRQVEALDERQALGLGSGYGLDSKRAAAARAELITARNELVADADSLISSLIQYATGKAPEPAAKPIADADFMTMWAITIIGACLLFGFATPFACIAGAGFLILTYLTHPPFPWYPLPPNTEGNPLFINKNIIECIALLTIATFPTGRWLGLDALVWLGWRMLTRKKSA